MRIAYIILAHKQPQQLIRLVSRLHMDEASFFIHIDKKTDDAVYRQFVEGLRHLPNVHFLRRHRSRWGEFPIVEATLEGIAEVCRGRLPVDYVVLLSGQDYPIKPNAYIRAFLEESRGRSYVDHHEVPSKTWPEAATRLRSWHVRVLGRSLLLPRRKAGLAILRTPRKWPALVVSYCMPKERRPLKGYKPFTGCAHWVVSGACARFINDFVATHRSFAGYFKYVCCPDETFFQTLVMNSPLAGEVESLSLHYIDWSKGGPHPAVLTVGDLPRLASSPALFARKFDVEVDETVLQLIDEELLGIAPAQPVAPSN